MKLKEQILKLFEDYYDENAFQTYAGCIDRERYKLIAHNFDNLLVDIYTLVKNYKEEDNQNEN